MQPSSLSLKKQVSIGIALIAFSGCLVPSNQTVSISPVSAAALTYSSGSRIAKIVFQQNSGSGSFDTAPSGGTADGPGLGFAATRVFNTDGSLQASGGVSNASWPQWLSLVEIGISGANNPSSPNSACANFAIAGEDQTPCALASPLGSSAQTSCGASQGLFRVSEVDCANGGTTAPGTGGPNDGIYVRVVLNRANLSPTENILAVLQYSASAYHSAPANPTTCFSNGVFNPSAAGCSDMVWDIFIKHTPTETVQPYLMLVPPALASVQAAPSGTPVVSGTGSATKQFYVPLAADPNLSVIQISRISGVSSTAADIEAACNGASTPARSALCAGMVLYSLTLYRI